MTDSLHTFHIPVMGIGYSVDTPYPRCAFWHFIRYFTRR